MNTPDSRGTAGGDRSLMDEILRAGVPDIKLALGEVIDRENARPLPPKYARLLPDTVLLVTLRSDAADALRPIAADLERELSDSCNRHGSLYDRRYRVELQRTDDPEATLYSVAVHAGRESPAEAASSGGDSPLGRTPPPGGTPSAAPPLPVGPTRATPAEAGAAPVRPAGERFDAGKWVLIVEGDGGEDREVFRIGEPIATVGRGSDDPTLRPSITISDAPHVSRRQLALAWAERDGAPGFTIYNLGLNDVHLPGRDVPGARLGKGPLDLSSIAPDFSGWLPPGVPLRIGEHGPTLRVEEVPPGPDDIWIDPDATIFD